ncbi:hypothetical protein VIOR103205_13710 [Vibrio ordalii]
MSMSMTTYEMARIWEQLDESPEKVMFGKLGHDSNRLI